MADRHSNRVTTSFDAGTRLGETDERDMLIVPVGPDLRMVFVGTPEYCLNDPMPADPADLARHTGVKDRLGVGGDLLSLEFERVVREIKRLRSAS